MVCVLGNARDVEVYRETFAARRLGVARIFCGDCTIVSRRLHSIARGLECKTAPTSRSWRGPKFNVWRFVPKREFALRVIGWCEAVLNTPIVPVIDGGARQQNSDAARQWTEGREQPRPTMDRLHACVEAHRPAPEQRCAFGGRAAVGDLLDLAFAAVARDGKDRCGVHGKQQRRAIQERDREHMERIVEEVAVIEREVVRPIQMRE